MIYLINGSGLGGAILAGDAVYATEPGHVKVASQLNPFGQSKPCGMDSARYPATPCVEAVAAGKAGVEDLWRQRTLRRLSGRDICARYRAGDALARALHDSSAQITAHAIQEMAKAFRLTDPGRLVVGRTRRNIPRPGLRR